MQGFIAENKTVHKDFVMVRKKLTIASLFIPTMLCAALANATDTVRKPNVLVIVADDLGFSDTEPFGSEMALLHKDLKDNTLLI
ncbi:hypothetical protein APC61_11470 [Acinetobacter baumannii]|uniref:hypothetical protein n=1 Tax=Acinetobacter baumannii TaxID=470 RepID=UPI00071108DB|nr:hypothetical protein [Acinetobacter baumannii]KRI67615.1 hypothetical protein APC61_11470 [Acinetobacter baumannii]